MPKKNEQTIKIPVKKKVFKPRKNIKKSPKKNSKKQFELLEESKNWRKESLKEKNSLSEKEKQEIKKTYGQGFYEKDEKYKEDNDYESDKKLMMWAGITFLMTAILFFWILNIKNILKSDSVENAGEFKWTEVRSEIDDIMGDIEKNIDNIEFKAEEESKDKEEIELSKEADNISEETIIDLKNKIEELEQKMEDE
jgi:hypothetical protein